MFTQVVQNTRDVMIDELKRFFNESTIPEIAEFRYTETNLGDDTGTSLDETKIFISGKRPREERKFPGVYVRAIPGNSQEIGFGQVMGRRVGKVGAVDEGKEFIQFGTYVIMTLEFLVAAWDSVLRDKLVDVMFIALIRSVRKELEKRGIEPRPGQYVTFGGEFEEKFSEDKYIYGNSLRYPVQVPWYIEEEITEETLQEIDLSGIQIDQLHDISGRPLSS